MDGASVAAEGGGLAMDISCRSVSYYHIIMGESKGPTPQKNTKFPKKYSRSYLKGFWTTLEDFFRLVHTYKHHPLFSRKEVMIWTIHLQGKTCSINKSSRIIKYHCPLYVHNLPENWLIPIVYDESPFMLWSLIPPGSLTARPSKWFPTRKGKRLPFPSIFRGKLAVKLRGCSP